MDLNDYRFYPICITPIGNEFCGQIRGIEGAVTNGRDVNEVQFLAPSLIRDWALFCHQDWQLMPPAATPQDDDYICDIGVDSALKIMIRNLMLEQKIKAKKLADSLGFTPQRLNTVLDMSKSTKLQTLADVFVALNRPLKISC